MKKEGNETQFIFILLTLLALFPFIRAAVSKTEFRDAENVGDGDSN